MVIEQEYELDLKTIEFLRKLVTPEEFFDICVKVLRNPNLPKASEDNPEASRERRGIANKWIIKELEAFIRGKG